MSLRLNLGASDDRREGFDSVDIAPPADVVCDLRERWPWKYGEVEEIYAKDVAEHIGNCYRLMKEFVCSECGDSEFYDDHRPEFCGCGGGFVLHNVQLQYYNGMIHFMNEAHRVLKPGGRMELIVPCYPGIAPWCDPTHASVWTSDTKYYFDERWNNPQGERGRLGPAYGITALFRTVGGRSGPDWTPIAYAPDAPERRKLFLVLEAVK